MRDEAFAFGAVAVLVIPEPGYIPKEQGDVMIDVPESPILTYEGKTVINYCKSRKVGSIVYNDGV